MIAPATRTARPPLTPKDFAAALRGLRTERWIRERCARGYRGRDRIRTIAGPPYLIPATELDRFIR